MALTVTPTPTKEDTDAGVRRVGVALSPGGGARGARGHPGDLGRHAPVRWLPHARADRGPRRPRPPARRQSVDEPRARGRIPAPVRQPPQRATRKRARLTPAETVRRPRRGLPGMTPDTLL